ncbi:MAG: acyl carrier protein [Ilumatobacteraceae bacterium]
MRTDRLDRLQGTLTEMIVTEITYGQPVEPETDLLLTGLVDSIGVIRIVTWLEDHLEIEIDPVDVVLDNFQTVNLIVEYAGRR